MARERMTTCPSCMGFGDESAPVGSGVVEVTTSIIEFGVGVACLVLAWTMLTASRGRWLAAALAVAGATAAVHAVGALVAARA